MIHICSPLEDAIRIGAFLICIGVIYLLYRVVRKLKEKAHYGSF